MRLDNSAGGLLTITTVDGLVGVSNSGPGAVRFAADDMNVLQPVSATTGNIDLFSSNATRTIGLGSAGAVKSSGFDGTNAAFKLTDAELDLLTTAGSRRLFGNGSSDDLFNIHYGGNDMQSLTVLGFGGEDQFFVAPSSTMPLNLDGGAPSAPTMPGDTLHLDMSAASPIVIVDTIGGFAISSSTADISYVEMETLDLCDNSGDIDDADVGDLYVRTTDSRESIVFTLWNDGGVKLRVDDLTNRASTTFPQHFGLVGGVQMLQQLLVFAQGGNDFVRVAGHVVGGNGDPIPVEFHGEDGNDYLAARSGDDSLWGGGGNDRLYGAAGDDVLNGGGGRDSLDGGADTDILRGGPGDDTISGSYGNDVLVGGAGNDRLYGRQGNDVILGGDGADRLSGDADNDLIVAGTMDQDNANDAALLSILGAWSGSSTNNLTNITGDGLRDDLSGGLAADEFWAEILPAPPTDLVRDAGLSDSVNDEA